MLETKGNVSRYTSITDYTMQRRLRKQQTANSGKPISRKQHSIQMVPSSGEQTLAALAHHTTKYSAKQQETKIYTLETINFDFTKNPDSHPKISPNSGVISSAFIISTVFAFPVAIKRCASHSAHFKESSPCE